MTALIPRLSGGCARNLSSSDVAHAAQAEASLSTDSFVHDSEDGIHAVDPLSSAVVPGSASEEWRLKRFLPSCE